jgi:hypothetical protein
MVYTGAESISIISVHHHRLFPSESDWNGIHASKPYIVKEINTLLLLLLPGLSRRRTTLESTLHDNAIITFPIF